MNYSIRNAIKCGHIIFTNDIVIVIVHACARRGSRDEPIRV